MEIIFERAKLLIMLIFLNSVKSLEDQTLRHFSGAANCFSKLSFAKASESIEKETPRQTHFVGQFICWTERFVGCGPIFPNHNNSVYDLFSSNQRHPLKASNLSKSFSTDFSSRAKHASTYWDNLYSLPVKFIPIFNWTFLIEFVKISTAINSINTRKRTALPYTAF